MGDGDIEEIKIDMILLIIFLDIHFQNMVCIISNSVAHCAIKMLQAHA